MGKNGRNKAKTAQTEPEPAKVPESNDIERVKAISFADFKRSVAGAASLNPEIGNRATISEAGRWLSAVVVALVDAVGNGEESVRIPELGTFSVVERAERNGVNPQTGAKIVIPASKSVKFSPAAALKRLVNGDLA
jgi:DNA-binding protein HU-beta